MQDLKHLTQKKRFSRFVSARPTQANRRVGDTRASAQSAAPLLNVRRRRKLGYLALFLAVILLVAPLCLMALRTASKAVSAMVAWVGRQPGQTPRLAEAARHPAPSAFETASSLLDSAIVSGDRLTARTPSGALLQYSILPELQKRVHDFMEEKQVPYGVFVAIEPSSGRILAMTSHSSANPDWKGRAFYDLYPMASLFKIITASAALENRRMTPDTVVEFRGGSYSENPRYWQVSPRGRNNSLDVTYAMGKSINPVYGRVAADIAGKESVMDYVNRFGFNQVLLPGTPVKQSRAAAPESTHGLMQMGAGLDHEVKISPLHAAVMMAAIANGGRMMAPSLTERVMEPGGTARESHPPREIRRPVSPETADSLTRMLSSTVVTGTSRRAFHDRRGRPLLDVDVCAKTGSIDGTDPQGHYSWFAAYAPARNPRIALVALIINQDRWKIKSSQVGAQALEEFFEKRGLP